jgi:hypothetical protein
MRALEALLLNGYEVQFKGREKVALPFTVTLWKDNFIVETEKDCYNRRHLKKVLRGWTEKHIYKN